MGLTTAYIPGLRDIIGLVITWAVAVILLSAGAALIGSRMPPEVQIGAGWGALCLLLTAWGTFVPFSLAFPAAVFFALALSALAFRDRRPTSATWRTLGRLTLLTLPFWLVMAPIQPSQPDTWLNLLPNAVYLVDWGRLPTALLPPSHSYLPAAPYNTQFLSYLGALIWPDYPVAGTSLSNGLLLLATGLLFARSLCSPTPAVDAVLPWSAIAVGLLFVIPLNPGFVPRFHLSAYGETALAATAVMVGWLLVSALGEIAADRRPNDTLPAVALIFAAMINTKQSGLGLVTACTGAALATSWLEGGQRCRAMLRFVGLAVLPSLGLYALWRYHVSVAGVDELKLLPFAQWNWIALPAILASIGTEVAEKPVYFGCTAAVLIAWPMLLQRQGWTPTTRLLAYHAALLVLYNAFLLLTYIALFPREMSIEAHSFFRYNTHVSLVLSLCMALAARDLGFGRWLVGKRQQAAGCVAVAITLLAPLGYAYRLRFDLDMPQPLVRNLANNVKAFLADGDRLVLLLPDDNKSVATMIEGVLTETTPRRRGLDLLRRNTADQATLDEAARLGYRFALISCVPEGWEDLPPNQAVLLRHDATGWHLLAAWPYPEDAFQQRWQQILSWGPLCRRS